jgi:ACT domain-containing protein
MEVTGMRAVITVLGKDMVGILAKVSTKCAEYDVNVIEVTQSILQDLFAMIMMVDISKSSVPFDELVDSLKAMGEEMGMTVHVMHEDIFNSMHRI